MNLRNQLIVKRALWQAARQVQRSTGKSVFAQFRELASLRRAPGKLRAADYYAQGVYDDARYPGAAKYGVVTWSGHTLGAILNDAHWRAICDDKLICYGLLRAFELPFPEVYATYHPGGRTTGIDPALSDPAAVASYLRDGMPYPFFAKPVASSFGKGASFVKEIDRDGDRLRLMNGDTVGVGEYVTQFVAPQVDGYLFQAPIRQHPEIDRISGGRVSTLRMVVLNGDEGPRLFRVLWKMPAGGSITDNFEAGVSGNLLGLVDCQTGVVERMAQGSGLLGPGVPRWGRLASEVELHPDTGERVTGITLPDWERTVAVCLRGAAAFPGIRYQSWDLAMGHNGPLILELNFRGAVLQVPGSRGFNDDQMQAFLSKYAQDSSK